ncbi:D-alanyl-D-alanine carboxypeptidase family protein [Paratractidigestivibacter sp.]|uniref:D-alanyl-D-alanine carboxypeptidase family protein n=1 Tax=Paratractidigestivibacter sp. TaxID=2847316 RepID=UPI002ABD5273|nr:D-alanyl-D-alanine carboxypeptidase family protein [Paratractidigestivibacter sp.]
MTSQNRFSLTRAALAAALALSFAFLPALARSAAAVDVVETSATSAATGGDAVTSGATASDASTSDAATSATATALAVSVDGEALSNPTEAPETYTPAAFLVDRDNGQVLYAKEADARRYPASTTKVMTALIVLERCKLTDVVTVEAGDFTELGEDSMMSGIQVDEQLTVKDLLACMLLPSGNDAAYVLARAAGGSWQQFVALMNARATELGCEDTHFANPCGLHDDNHYTTARDLCRIFEAALQNEMFCEIAGAATWTLPATNKNESRVLETTDYLIDAESDAYAEGMTVIGKTGYTLEGGKCLVVAAEKDGRHLAAVTLGGENDAEYGTATSNFYGMRDLLNWGFDAWETTDVVKRGDVLASVGVALSEDGTSVGAAASGAVNAFVPAGLALADLTIEADVPDSVEAAVSQGDPLGEVMVSYAGRYLGSIPVAAASSMGWSLRLFVGAWLSEPAHQLIVGAVLVVILAIVIALIARGRRRCKPASAPEDGADRRNADAKAPGAARGGAHFK